MLFAFILSLSFVGDDNHHFYDISWVVIITALDWLAVGWLTTGEFSWKYPWRDDSGINPDSTVAFLSQSSEVT